MVQIIEHLAIIDYQVGMQDIVHGMMHIIIKFFMTGRMRNADKVFHSTYLKLTEWTSMYTKMQIDRERRDKEEQAK